MSIRILTVAALLAATGTAAAQGFQVRTWGYYDRYPYPPSVGGTYSYSPYPPMVTIQDPWGRAIDMPLQPKVLYYDTPFLTPGGWYRPTSIVVMPDSRPRYYAMPPRIPEPVYPAIPPTLRHEASPASPTPDTLGTPATRSIPTVPVPIPRREAKPGLPPVPEVPKFPEVPRAPSTEAGPKLGPAPMDEPPVKRPPG